ncbi:YadA-like family protein [Candidatus Spongiihabitans sp.]|uniref:YadA-like family protein n=1 Tax=Candidatus Spongiihabitans sp. TaxID=3101308 RepID=UPI003C7D0487
MTTLPVFNNIRVALLICYFFLSKPRGFIHENIQHQKPDQQNSGGGGSTLALLFTITAVGLAVPAYGQTDTNTDTITSPDCTTVPAAAGTGGIQTGADASSFAAGCGAEANTDGSVAIGEGATVEEYNVITVVASVPGVATHTYYSDLETNADGVPLNNAVGMTVEKDQDGVLHVVANGARTGVIDEDADKKSALIKLTGAGTPGSTTTVQEGDNGIAIGNQARVVGENSVAIGPGASVVKTTTTVVASVPGVATHTYYSDSETSAGGIPLNNAVGMTVEKDQDGVLHVVANGARTGVIDEGADKKSALIKLTGAGTPGSTTTVDTPVLNAVAIGDSSSVTGDRGVALGAGASAAENGIAIGAGVEAGADEIRIGGESQTNVRVGAYDLDTITDNGVRIDTNVAGIDTNAGGIAANVADISTNAGGIATNVADISTNAGGIATNVADISTNADDIETNTAGIDTNAGGIAANVADISTNAGGIATNVADISTNADDIETNTAGIATAVALAGLPVFKGGTGGWGIALGSFEGETAIAIGANYNLNQGSSLIRFGISTSSGGTSGTIGFGKGF